MFDYSKKFIKTALLTAVLCLLIIDITFPVAHCHGNVTLDKGTIAQVTLGTRGYCINMVGQAGNKTCTNDPLSQLHSNRLIL